MIASNHGNTGIPENYVSKIPVGEKDWLRVLTGPPTPTLASTPGVKLPALRVQNWLATAPVSPTLAPPEWMPKPKMLGPMTQARVDEGIVRQKAEYNLIALAQEQDTLSGRRFDANQAVTNLHQATAGTLFDDHKMVRQTYFDLTPEQLQAVKLVYSQRYPAGAEREVLGVMPEKDRAAILKLYQLENPNRRREALTDLLLDSTLGNKSGDKTKEVLSYIWPEELADVESRFRSSAQNPTKVGLDKAAAELMWDQEDKRVVTAKAQGDKAKLGVAEMRQTLWEHNADEAIDRLRQMKPAERVAFEKQFNAEVENARQTQLFNGAPLADWVQAESGLQVLKGMEARALLKGEDAKADVLRIASGEYGEKKEYLWRALGGNLQGEARDQHLTKVKAAWAEAKTGESLEKFLSQRLDPLSKEQALTLLNGRDVSVGKQLTYDLAGWSKDSEHAAALILKLGPEEAKKAFAEALPEGIKLSLDQVVAANFGGRERFALQQALKGRPESVEQKLKRAEERVQFEHTGFAFFTDAGKNLDDKLAELKGYASQYREAVKRGDSKLAEAAKRQVDMVYAAVNGNAEVHRLEEKGTGEYSAMAIQMTAAIATALPTGFTSLELAVMGGLLSTAVNAGAQGDGYDERKLAGDLAVNTLKSIPLGAGESKVVGAVASGLAKDLGGGAVVQKVIGWGLEFGTQSSIYNGTISTAQGLADGKGLDQALAQGFKAAQDGFLPGAGIGIAVGAAGEAFKAMFPKKGGAAPKPLEVEAVGGDAVKRAATPEEFVSPEFYRSSSRYQGLSETARSDFDRLMSDMASRGKLVEGRSMVHLLEEGSLAVLDKKGKSLLESLTSLRDQPRLPEFHARQAEIFDQAMQSMADPALITQGYNPTCTATSQQIGHAVADPADYLRVVDELTRTGEATLASGQKMRLNQSTLKGFAAGDNRTLVDAIYQDSAMQFGLESALGGKRVDYISNRPNFQAKDGSLYPLTPEVAEQIQARGGSMADGAVTMRGADGQMQTFKIVNDSGAILPGSKPVMVEGIEMMRAATGLEPVERLALTEGVFGRRVHDLKLPDGFQERMAARDLGVLTHEDRLAMTGLMTAAADAQVSGRSVSISVNWGKGGHALQLVGIAEDGRFLVRNPQMSGPDINFSEYGRGLPRDNSIAAVGLANHEGAVSAVDHFTMGANLKSAQATRFKPGR